MSWCRSILFFELCRLASVWLAGGSLPLETRSSAPYLHPICSLIYGEAARKEYNKPVDLPAHWCMIRLMSPQLTETDKAWAAGLFDGEGCVWTRWPNRNNLISIEMRMTCETTMSKWNSMFPGRFVAAHLSGPSKKSQWKWTLETNLAKSFLPQILPFLVTKKEVCGLAVKMIETQNNGGRLTPFIRETRNQIAAQIKAINV